jgi:hypothetical protein
MFEFLTCEGGTDKLSRNVDKKFASLLDARSRQVILKIKKNGEEFTAVEDFTVIFHSVS